MIDHRSALGLRFGCNYSLTPLLMKNTGSDSCDVSRYVVAYRTGYTHQIATLVLEAGAQLALMSRDGEDTVLQSSSPVSLRYLAADTAPLLDENGTIRLRDAKDDLVDTVAYKECGCDNGGETGDELACPH